MSGCGFVPKSCVQVCKLVGGPKEFFPVLGRAKAGIDFQSGRELEI